MAIDALPALTDAARWPAEAGRVLESLGFILVAGEPTSAGPQAVLLAAMRERPSMHHFDPEEIAYWITDQGRGRQARLDRAAVATAAGAYAWGTIQLIDRLGVRNEFLSFGGSLRVEDSDAATRLVAFVSPAPILRLAGHSQGLDPLSPDVGSFFGRLKIPIDFVPGAESRIGLTNPAVLYAAFVQDLRARFAGSGPLRDAHRDSAGWAAREASRLESAAPGEWKAAIDLRRELGLGAP